MKCYSGASGTLNDYCLKIVDAATNASGAAKIDFPQTYGGMEDSYHKYRFEMDWKWHTLTGTPPSTLTSLGSPTGATIINFYIGGKTLSLNSKNNNSGATGAVPVTSEVWCFTLLKWQATITMACHMIFQRIRFKAVR